MWIEATRRKNLRIHPYIVNQFLHKYLLIGCLNIIDDIICAIQQLCIDFAAIKSDDWILRDRAAGIVEYLCMNQFDIILPARIITTDLFDGCLDNPVIILHRISCNFRIIHCGNKLMLTYMDMFYEIIDLYQLSINLAKIHAYVLVDGNRNILFINSE